MKTSLGSRISDFARWYGYICGSVVAEMLCLPLVYLVRGGRLADMPTNLLPAVCRRNF